MAVANTVTTSVSTSVTPLGLPTFGAAVGTNCLVIANLGAVIVYLGDSKVSATNGIPMAAAATLVLPGATGNGMYALAASSTANVAVSAF